MKRMLIAASLAALSGCTLASSLERSAVDYNQAIDQVEKELLLLNVVRSTRGESMTYSGIGEMRGAFSVSASAGLAIPLGNATVPEGTVSSSGSVSSSPSLQVVPLSTAEFYRGITSGVSPELLSVFWEYGFTKELLLYLLVEKIEISSTVGNEDVSCPYASETMGSEGTWKRIRENENEKGEFDQGVFKIKCTYENKPPQPGNKQGIAAFSAFQHVLEAGQPEPFKTSIEGASVGPRVTEANIVHLKAVADAHDGELVLKSATEPDGKTIRYFMAEKDISIVRYTIGEALKSAIKTNVEPSVKKEAPQNFTFITKFRANRVQLPQVQSVAPSDTGEIYERLEVKSTVAKRVSISLVLRSPEGIIYYLGELARVSLKRTEKSRLATAYRKIYGSRESCAGSKVENPIDLNSLRDFGDNKPTQPTSDLDSNCVVPIFVMFDGEGDADVAVETRGTRYYIPSEKVRESKSRYIAGQTLRAMAIARELFNLNTSRKDLPTTQSVINVGGQQ